MYRKYIPASPRINVLADADSLLEKMLYNYQRGGATIVETLIAQRAASDVQLAYCDAMNDRAHVLDSLFLN